MVPITSAHAWSSASSTGQNKSCVSRQEGGPGLWFQSIVLAFQYQSGHWPTRNVVESRVCPWSFRGYGCSRPTVLIWLILKSGNLNDSKKPDFPSCCIPFHILYWSYQFIHDRLPEPIQYDNKVFLWPVTRGSMGKVGDKAVYIRGNQSLLSESINSSSSSSNFSESKTPPFTN